MYENLVTHKITENALLAFPFKKFFHKIYDTSSIKFIDIVLCTKISINLKST